MNQLCAHGKVEKDTAMARVVPGIKRSLEEFILRVKVALQANDCANAFWVGNLKHRTVSGEEVRAALDEDEEDDSGEDSGEGQEVAEGEGGGGGEDDDDADEEDNNSS